MENKEVSIEKLNGWRNPTDEEFYKIKPVINQIYKINKNNTKIGIIIYTVLLIVMIIGIPIYIMNNNLKSTDYIALTLIACLPIIALPIAISSKKSKDKSYENMKCKVLDCEFYSVTDNTLKPIIGNVLLYSNGKKMNAGGKFVKIKTKDNQYCLTKFIVDHEVINSFENGNSIDALLICIEPGYIRQLIPKCDLDKFL